VTERDLHADHAHRDELVNIPCAYTVG
jgi:hypothetical protein